jgi:hypothetical protein
MMTKAANAEYRRHFFDITLPCIRSRPARYNNNPNYKLLSLSFSSLTFCTKSSCEMVMGFF